MKVGTENTRKTMLAIGLAVVALFMVIRMFDFGSSTPAAAPANATATPAPTPARRPVARHGRPGDKSTATGPVTPSLDPRLHLGDLKRTENTEYTGKGRNIFLAQAEDVVIEKPIASGIKKPEPQPQQQVQYTPPPPPPIELKFFGFASSQGTKRVFLSSPNNDIFVASEGDIVNRRYKIVKINSNNIEVLDVLNNNQQTIPLTTS